MTPDGLASCQEARGRCRRALQSRPPADPHTTAPWTRSVDGSAKQIGATVGLCDSKRAATPTSILTHFESARTAKRLIFKGMDLVPFYGISTHTRPAATESLQRACARMRYVASHLDRPEHAGVDQCLPHLLNGLPGLLANEQR